MVERIKGLARQYRDIVIYVIFGIVTTVVNYAIYLPLYNLAGLSATLSNVIAWTGAVLVAFLTNKPLVFHSNCWKREVVVPELLKFVSCRLGSGILESGLLFVTVDWLCWNGNIWKLIISVLVIVLNYVGSKLLVFRK